MENILFQFIPIIIIILFFTFTKSAITFSNTVLGRFIAVVLIAYYTIIDAVLGLLVCVLIIYYYQSDYVEGMLNLSNGYSEKMKIVVHKIDIDEVNNTVEEEEDEIIVIDNIPNVDAVSEFKKNYCVKNGVFVNEKLVNPEMAHHVLPEIVYDDIDNRCNPCDKKCKYSVVKRETADDDDDIQEVVFKSTNITEKKIETEKELMPKKSNDFMSGVMEKIFGNFSPNESQDVVSESFSKF